MKTENVFEYYSIIQYNTYVNKELHAQLSANDLIFVVYFLLKSVKQIILIFKIWPLMWCILRYKKDEHD